MSFLSKCFLHKLIIDEQTEAQKVHRICSSNSNSSSGWGRDARQQKQMSISHREKQSHLYALNLCTPESCMEGAVLGWSWGQMSPQILLLLDELPPPPKKKVESLIGEGIPTNDGGKGGPASHRSLHYMG